MCSVGDTRWLSVSTEQLYRTTHSSGKKSCRHRHKSRVPPLTTPAAPQCEVAFPGNRIFSPSATDNVQRKTDHIVDVRPTDVSSDADYSREPSDDDLLSMDNEISQKVSSQLVTEFCGTDTNIAASDCLTSLTMRPAELGNNSEIVENTVNGSAGSNGIYMENGSAGDVPLEPLKAEKLATFGEFIYFFFIIVNVTFHFVCVFVTTSLSHIIALCYQHNLYLTIPLPCDSGKGKGKRRFV